MYLGLQHPTFESLTSSGAAEGDMQSFENMFYALVIIK